MSGFTISIRLHDINKECGDELGAGYTACIEVETFEHRMTDEKRVSQN
jgi:hypothetical protein